MTTTMDDPPALMWEAVRSHDRWNAASRRKLADVASLDNFLDAGLHARRWSYGEMTWALALGLPLRQAVWWACLCVERSRHGHYSLEDSHALGAATAWVLEPTSDRRRIAEIVGERGKTSAFCCCAAAGRAGHFDNGQWWMLLPKTAAGLVQSAVIYASAEARETSAAVTDRQFVLLGLEILRGRFPWIEAP